MSSTRTANEGQGVYRDSTVERLSSRGKKFKSPARPLTVFYSRASLPVPRSGATNRAPTTNSGLRRPESTGGCYVGVELAPFRSGRMDRRSRRSWSSISGAGILSGSLAPVGLSRRLQVLLHERQGNQQAGCRRRRALVTDPARAARRGGGRWPREAYRSARPPKKRWPRTVSPSR